jgi:hypothetical protein
MNHWPVQIYGVSDDHAQELIVGLLSGVDDLTVEPATSGPDRFVIVECVDRDQAHSVGRVITAIDFEATLIHSAECPVVSLTA